MGKKLRNAWIWRASGEREVDILVKLKALGIDMNKQHLSRILMNPFYTDTGWIVHELVEGRRIRGNHEVLIDEDTFNRANGYSRAGYEHREQTNEFPLKRHVRCAACGNYLTGYEVKARHKFYSGRKHCYEMGAYTGVLPAGYVREGKSINAVCKLNDEGRKIAKAFRWKIEGYSNAEILEKLKIIGLNITKQTLNHYFNNPFYAGKIRSSLLDEGMVDGKIEKAISYEDWLLVPKIMSDRSGKYKHKKRKENFPLKRFVYCDDCGTPFTAYTVKAKHCDYYKCNKIGCGTNIAAKKLHDSFFSLLKSMDIPMELLTQYESMLRSMVRTNDEESIKHATLLKKQRSEKEKELANCRRRFATGQFVDEDLYRETVTELQGEIAAIDAELENYKENLSNLDRKIRDILVTCSKLSVLWRDSDIETRQRIPKLTFPHGIFWNNKNHNYRTENRNEAYDLFDRITGSYGNKKETPSEEDVSECAG